MSRITSKSNLELDSEGEVQELISTRASQKT